MSHPDPLYDPIDEIAEYEEPKPVSDEEVW